VKLHLGCGERYFPGYLNIDFPAASRSAQSAPVADLEADILSLRYPAASIAEVRLHHVFEHFTRPVACGLLASWHSWLATGGILRVEVPDFRRTALAYLNPLSHGRSRSVARRHIFGSHEAPWAVHCEGYGPGDLKSMVEAFGYRTVRVARNGWKGTYNVEVIAEKETYPLSEADLGERAYSYLGAFLLDGSGTEARILERWIGIFREQVGRSFAG
jgi:hypothetical protein